jgi:hypothetical protein
MEQDEKLFTFSLCFSSQNRYICLFRQWKNIGVWHIELRAQPAAYLGRIHYASSCNVQSTRWRQFEAWSDESDTKQGY